MMQRETPLSELQRDILELIVNQHIETVNYGSPKKQLGKIAEDYNKTIDALSSLDRDFQVLSFVPKSGFFRNCSFYQVNIARLMEVYSRIKDSEHPTTYG